MGNTCGCVRGQREECEIDPAKAPLSHSPDSRHGRLYLRRKHKKKTAPSPPPPQGDPVKQTHDPPDVFLAGPLAARGEEGFDGKPDSQHLPSHRGTALPGVLSSADRHPGCLQLGDAGKPRSPSSSAVSTVCESDREATGVNGPRGIGVMDGEGSSHVKSGGVGRRLECHPDLPASKLKTPINLGAIVQPAEGLRGEVSPDSMAGIYRGPRNAASAEQPWHVRSHLPHEETPIPVLKAHTKSQRTPTSRSDSSPAELIKSSPRPVRRMTRESAMCRHKYSDGNGITSVRLNEISDIHVTGESEDMSAKERLLLWSQQMTEGYTGIRCENFTSCWRDGRLFNAIIHKYRPDLINMSQVTVQSNLSNLEHAFGVAERLGVTRLLDPEDVNVPSPDEKSVITYVSSLYDAFPKIPEGGEGISANDVEVKWIEYQNMVNYLVQWIKHHVTVMSDRSFSNNPAELKALYNQYIQFKDTEIPPKERDKAKIKHLYKLMEVWIEFGRIKLPQGYHPNDVEKEWGKLIIAMLEREKLLRPEVERLEMLQQIGTRIQHDSMACENKLTLARNSLQLDAKRLESGLQFQNETEIAGYLLESENLIRQQIIDVQILIDGKYYQADQLVQRVAELRDDLMSLKSECSSVYSQGRSMSAEQTKLMMAGLTQSLNQSFSSGFSQSLTPTFNSSSSLSLTPGLTPSLTRSFAPVLPPSLPVSLSSGIKPVMTHGFISGFIPGVDPDTRQTIKLMQIRKPLMRSQLANQSLTQDEINMKFVQDLLSWVEEMQVQLDRAEWGSDMPSVESHLENHRNVHRAIEEFELSIKEAKSAENQITSPLKNSYSEKLRMLENHYSKLLTTSKHRATHLESLRSFISRATKELIWLNEKEEEEVAYDWSDRNSSMLRKREYHSELMGELEDKDTLMRSVQDDADQLLLDHHPARLTIEAFKAAMQTQWSWVLQLCHCVEQHLRENTAYFEFYNDAKESLDYLKNLQETIKRKYSCEKTSSLVRLEDLLQDSMDEKEQLLQYRSNVAGLMSRAKAVVQLKPRNPDNPLRISIPIKAICDYKQIEITIYKDDECVLENNSHRAKWKVISPTGNEAMVPSVCFTVPPPNKEAIETTNRIEQLYQNVLALWHQTHIDMKSIISWHLLMTEISTIRAWNSSSIKTMLPGEHQQVLSNLQEHYDIFLEDSQESDAFSITDRTQLEREVNFCKQYYKDLLKSAEREEQEESACNLFISEVRNIRLRVENCEERLIRQIRTPLERDDLQESVQRISEQEKLKSELEELIVDLEKVTEKCDKFFGQTCSSSSPTLRTELKVVLQNLNQVYSLSSIHLDKLKTVNLIVKNTQGAEALVKLYETKLGEEEAVPPNSEAIEFLQDTLKQWRSEVDERREVFHALEDELQKGKAISERMLRVHNERDMDVDWHKEKAVQLAERWENVRSQIDNRLHDLDSISVSLNSYRDCYKELDLWIQEMEVTQQKMQESQPEDIRALADELNQQKTLASEVETKQQKMDTCQKYSEQYSSTVKEYELHLMTYKAMVDSQQKSPVKRRRMQSSSDVIVQEFMDLRTRYTALVTLMTQYVKFASDALKRSEEEEKRRSLEDLATLGRQQQQQQQEDQRQRLLLEALGDENRTLVGRVNALELVMEELKEEKDSLGQELTRVLAAAEAEGRQQRQALEEISSRRVEAEGESSHCREELERAVRERAGSGRELERLRQALLGAEAGQVTAERELGALRREAEEGVSARRTLQEELEWRGAELQKLEEQKRELEEDLQLCKATETKMKEVQVGPPEPGSLAEDLEGPDTLNVDRHIASTLVVREEHTLLQPDPLREEERTREVEALRQALAEATWSRDKAQKDLRNLQFELDYLKQEKLLSEQAVSALRVQLDSVKENLEMAQGEMERACSSERENGIRSMELEERLRKSEQALEELSRQHEDLSWTSLAAEAQARVLKDEVRTIHWVKAASEKDVEHLRVEAEGLRAELKKAREELAKRGRASSRRECKSETEVAESWETTVELTGSCSLLENGVFALQSNSNHPQALEVVVETVKIRRASEELKPKVFQQSQTNPSSGLELGTQTALTRQPENREVPKPMQATPKAGPRTKLQKAWEEPGQKVDSERRMKEPEKEVVNSRCVAQELRRQVNGSEQRKREEAVKKGNNLPGERGQERGWSSALLRGLQPPQSASTNNTSEKISSKVTSHGSSRAKGCTAVADQTEHQFEALGNLMLMSAEMANQEQGKSRDVLDKASSLFANERLREMSECLASKEKEETQGIGRDLNCVYKGERSQSKKESKPGSNGRLSKGSPRQGDLLPGMRIGGGIHTSSPLVTLDTPRPLGAIMFDGLRRRVSAEELVAVGLLEREAAEQLGRGLKGVSEIQKSLCQYLNKVTSIAGLYLETSKRKVSFSEAVGEGLIGPSVALEFLEAQAATGCIIDVGSGATYSVQEALGKGLVASQDGERLLQAERGVTGFPHGGDLCSLSQAVENRLVHRETGRRLLEAQVATGGVVDPRRILRLPVQMACRQGLASPALLRGLHQPIANAGAYHEPNTGHPAHYSELLRLCVLDLAGNPRLHLLPVGARRVSSPSPARATTISVVDTGSGSELSAYEAYTKHYVDRPTYRELSERWSSWKETGGDQATSSRFLEDLSSGRRFSLEQALSGGLVSRAELAEHREGRTTATELADLLTSRAGVAKEDADSPIAGLWHPMGCGRLSVLKAMQQNLVDRLTAIRLLEAQACTGGILDPITGEMFSIPKALQNDLIDREMARSITKSHQAYTGFSQPGTDVTLSIMEAVARKLLNSELGLCLLEVQHLTGGLIDPRSPGRIPLEDALKRGIIDEQTAWMLGDEKAHVKNLVCPKTRRKISYKEALARALFDCHTGLRLLEVADRS